MPDSDSARQRPKPVRCCFKGQEGASWNQGGAFYGQTLLANLNFRFLRKNIR